MYVRLIIFKIGSEYQPKIIRLCRAGICSALALKLPNSDAMPSMLAYLTTIFYYKLSKNLWVIVFIVIALCLKNLHFVHLQLYF